jgi:hypothetical protein
MRPIGIPTIKDRIIQEAIRMVLRGWANYYRFVNSKETFNTIQLYSFQKFLKWYRGKYRMSLKKGTIKALEWTDRERDLHRVHLLCYDITLVSRLIEGEYPDYEKVIPVENGIRLTMETQRLLS